MIQSIFIPKKKATNNDHKNSIAATFVFSGIDVGQFSA